MKRKAYSYTRFSTPEQAEGTGKPRQDTEFAEWLQEHPEYERGDLTFHDAVSAFRGKNAKVGKLALFLRLIEEGKIEPGSVLVVEEWSRFSRQNPYDGAPVCRRIFDAGVGIVDKRNRIEYNATTMREQVIRLRLDMEWERAHRESEEKSIRMKAAWAHKREKAAQGIPMTKICPAWLRWVNGKYEVIEERAATVKLLFAMKADGVGNERIARTLNADPNVWHPKEHFKNRRGGWWPPYVDKVLRNPAVIGTYTSPATEDPIEGLFPPIVDRALWNRVQAQRGHGASDSDKAINKLFANVRCSYCDGTMTVVTKGSPPKGALYLLCDHARTGLGCIKQPIPYVALEQTLLHLTKDLNPALLMADQSELARQEAVRHQRRQALQDERDQLAREVDSLAESISRSEGARKRVLEAKLDEKVARQAELEQALTPSEFRRSHNPVKQVVDHLVNVGSLIERMEKLEGPELRELRARLKARLQQILGKIEIEPGSHQSKVVVHYVNGFTLHLVVDRQGNPTLYHFDGVVDVDADTSETVATERADRQRRLNRLVAKALREHSVKHHMTG